jgi:hypothetical protein
MIVDYGLGKELGNTGRKSSLAFCFHKLCVLLNSAKLLLTLTIGFQMTSDPKIEKI